MASISAVVITYNCADVIEDCLHSLKWVDEIVIVDLGSTDDTLAKLSAFRVRVASRAWVPSANPVRDYAASLATGDWILHLDPDERVSPALVKRLQQIAADTGKDTPVAVRMPRRNIAFGHWVQYGGRWPDWQVRFGLKGALHFSGVIHQTGELEQGELIQLEADPELGLVHYSVSKLAQLFERLPRYAQEHARQLYSQNVRFRPGQLVADGLHQFYRGFVEQQGYRDGIVGFVLALLWHGFYPVMINLYLWELGGYPGASQTPRPAQSGGALLGSFLRQRSIRDVLAHIARRELPGAGWFLNVASWLKRRVFGGVR